MKCLVVGVHPFEYKDKDTGESVSALVLSTVVNNVNYIGGKSASEIMINGKYQSALYGNIIRELKGNLDSLVNRFVNIDYDNNRQILDFVIMPKDDNSVVWGF